jgi:hypothetical protein
MPECDLLALLGPVQPLPGSALPDWASFLGEMVSAISKDFALASDHAQSSRPARQNRSIPYVDLYQPIVDLARRRLREIAGDPFA